MKRDKYLGVGIAGAGGVINYLWGGLDTMFIALLTVMALDFITGIICGGKAKQLDSQRAYIGITKKKMMILIMIAVSVVVDRMLNTPGVTRSLVIFYYFAMEGISIMENAALLGFPIPPKLRDILLQLQEKEE